MSNSGFLRSLFGHSPHDWKTVNLEAVVRTQVVDGPPGSPRFLPRTTGDCRGRTSYPRFTW